MTISFFRNDILEELDAIETSDLASDQFNSTKFGVVAYNAYIISTKGTAINVPDYQLTSFQIDGRVIGEEIGISLSDAGVGSPDGDTSYRITVSDTGLVQGFRQHGVALESTAVGVDAYFAIANDGLIEGQRQSGVEAQGGTESTIQNSGVIRAVAEFTDGSGTHAIFVSNQYDTILNTGTISAANAVDTSLSNSQSAAQAGATIRSALTQNSKGKAEGDLFRLVNDGEIISANAAISSSNGVDDIFNTGKIIGNIWLEAYADELANTGLIDGDVRLGDGDDALNGFGGRVSGVIDGGAGNDDIRSGYGDDYIIGGSGADFIHAGKGDDTVSYEGSAAGVRVDLRNDFAVGRGGDAQGDVLHQVENLKGTDFFDALFGNDGANTLDGGGNVDSLRGFAGNDVLIGGGGGDALIGDAGEDRLIGGAGTDRMYGDEQAGGADYADIFIFDDGDIGKFVGSGDRIVDFDALDTLDLSRIDADVTQAGDQAFTLLAQGVGFSGTAGEARINFLDGNRVLIFDTNGDGAEDGRIIFENDFTPLADQILL